MTYPINTTVPNVNNDPADDAPPMNTNFVNINLLLQQDLVAPGSPGNGFHEQVTYYTENIPAGLPTDPTSIAYTANAQSAGGVMTGLSVGSASGIAQNFLANQSGVFPLSCVRAFGNFSTIAFASPNPTVVAANNSFNTSLIQYIGLVGGVPTYRVTLTAGCTTGNNVIVLLQYSQYTFNILNPAYSFAGGVLTMNVPSVATGVKANYLVLQI